MRIPVLLTIALLWSGTQAFAAPGDEIGSAVRIINIVTAEYETDERRLETGDDVRQDELIEVSAEGTGEIRLRDDTKLALGPGSQLLLDEFVYNPELSGGAIVLNLVKGTFRFITGIAAKPAYVIRTPTASITVRGTIFDVNVHDSGLAWLLLIEGAIEVCNERDECRLHDEPGKVIWITPDGDLGNPVTWVNLPGRQEKPFETAFPFVVAPPLIDPNPIFTRGDFVDGYVPEGPGDDSEDVTPPPPPPIDCWNGWFQIGAKQTKSYVRKGYKVRRHRGGQRTIWCAKNGGTLPPPIACPPPAIGKLPFCKCGPGYKGRWPKCREIEPDRPCKRGDVKCNCKLKGLPYNSRTGKCGYDPSPTDPKKECLKKGWKWKGNRCVNPNASCRKGYVGKPPNCKKKSSGKCPRGFKGKPPNCKKKSSGKCPKGFKGRPPNCKLKKSNLNKRIRNGNKSQLSRLYGLKQRRR
ncbi:MAG: FecR domain-containing protein [Hyphomicrobium sp.]|nr:FecR domain-containing protein [Hyphomicrobium sp.]